MNSRRQFLKGSLTTALGLVGVGMQSVLQEAKAAVTPSGSDYKTLVVINLNGGNDSLNMLIPNTTAEYDLYEGARRNIAFSKSSLLPISPQGLPENSFGLSPRMSGLRDLFNQGDAAFVANVGSLVEPVTKAQVLNSQRSQVLPASIGAHNTQTAYWQADHSNRIDTNRQGWGGRLADEFNVNGVLPINISIGSSNRKVFQAHPIQQFYNVGLGGLVSIKDFRTNSSNPGIRARQKAFRALNELAANSSNPFLSHTGTLFQQGIDLNLTLQTALAAVPDLASRFANPASNSGGAFASSMARAAELTLARESLQARRQIIFLELPGFDTHSSHARNHGNLSQDLSAYLQVFNTIMKEEGVHDSVLLATTSEFGRNLAANGDGTDHAWGAQHIVVGGPVSGGQIFGQFPSLELNGADDYNGLGRMVPTLSITQYGATIASWFGVPQNRIASVFPNIANFSTSNIGFLG